MEEGGLAASVAAKIVSVLGKERAILAVGCFVDYEVQHMFFIIAIAVV